MVRVIVLIFTLFNLAACAGAGYAPNRSASDIPAHIDVIKLDQVYMSNSSAEVTSLNDPSQDISPSQNDQEVTSVTRANILNQLTNYGYKVVEDSSQADLTMRFFINYQPERWPLVGRSVVVLGRVYNNGNDLIYSVRTHQENSIGLIGAVVGASRDEMVSDTAREAVVKLVDEMRKGTKENLTYQVPATRTATTVNQPAMPGIQSAPPVPPATTTQTTTTETKTTISTSPNTGSNNVR